MVKIVSPSFCNEIKQVVSVRIGLGIMQAHKHKYTKQNKQKTSREKSLTLFQAGFFDLFKGKGLFGPQY